MPRQFVFSVLFGICLLLAVIFRDHALSGAFALYFGAPRFPNERDDPEPATTRAWISTVLFLPISAVLIGVASAAALANPRLEVLIGDFLPAIVVVALLFAGIASWRLAPRLRARHWRRKGMHPRAIWR